MKHAPIPVALGDGREVLVIPAHRIERWDQAEATRRTREAVADSSTAAAVRDLAERLGYRGDLTDLADLADWLGEQIASEHLLPIAMPTERLGRPVLDSPAGGADWSGTIPLRSLTDDVTTDTGWISIEVLDHTGIPFAELEVTLVHADGRRDAVVLDAKGRHTAQDVARGATTVYWPPRLELSEAARTAGGLDGFQRRSEDLTIRRVPRGQSLRLAQIDRHHRIVVDPPTPAITITAGRFAPQSSFPTAGILMPLLGVAFAEAFGDLGLPRSEPIYQIFGHAEADGDTAGNKALSDRRADVFAALLTGDVDTIQAVAQAEAWGLYEQQIMLRVLRCDPGAIDGESGEMTSRAVRLFQAEYRDGVFHRHCADDLAPRSPTLEVTGAMDPETSKALIEAFVVATSPRIRPERMHHTHATAGCSEFNRVQPQPDARDRRLTIVMHDALPEDHDPQPCVRGDHGACPLDGKDPHVQCSWYRHHVAEAAADPVHRHFDLRWLQLPNGKLLLSAVTSVPDDEEVTFQVFWTKPLASLDELGDEALGEPLTTAKVALVRGGVAQLVWEPPAGFDLFDVDAWLVAAPARSPIAAWTSVQRSRFPVFRVSGGGATAIAPPPGDDAARIASELAARESGEPLRDVLALDAFGRIHSAALHDGRVNDRQHALAPDEPRVVSLRFLAAYLPPDDEAPR